jgi:putative nucleotidyltransferase with HDIG domain
MRIWVYDLKHGDKITNDVFNDYGLHVMSSGTIIGDKEIVKLKQLNIDYVDIAVREEYYEPTEKEINYSKQRISANVQPKFSNAAQGIKELFDQAIAENRIDDEQVNLKFEPLVQSMEKEKDVVSLLIQLNTQDDYTYQHSVQVGIISYYIAKWMELPEKEALFIGKAGYLHDIGKSKISKEILQKPSKLSDVEFEEIKKHTIYGNEILKTNVKYPLLATVALQHHERMNGLGYPFGILGKDIHLYSRIVGVADIYSAMISTRAYQKKRDLLFVLKELHRLSFEELDPKVTHTFIINMLPNFVGKKLLLTTGEIGQIVLTNPSDFFRPLVKIDGDFVDLSKQRSLQIEQIYV